MTSKSGSNELFPKTALQKILGTHPVLVHPNLAMIIGVTNSICWQQLNYWINNDSTKNIFEGRKWVYNTYAQWREQLPFLAEITIKKAFQEMERMGIVLSRMEGRVKYYSIDYTAVAKILEGDISEENTANREAAIHLEDRDRNDPDKIHPHHPDIIYPIEGYNISDSRIEYIRTYIDTETTQRLHIERDTRAREPAIAPVSVFSKNAPLKEDQVPKDRKKGTTLDVNWTLPENWRDWSIQCGMMHEEIDLTEAKFRNYWLSTTKNSVKKDWFLTWQNWCMNEYERKGMRLMVKKAAPIVKPPVAKSVPVRKSADPKIQKWNDLQQLLKDRVGISNYESWLERNFELVEADKKAVFRVNSNFMRDTIRLRFGSDLAAVLLEIDPKLGEEEDIEFIVQPR